MTQMESQQDTAMVSHPLSRVYGQYVITENGAPVFVTANIELLFEQLGEVDFRTASNLRVLLVSSEEFDSDDITAFVWREMVERATGSTWLPADWDAFRDITGSKSGFLELGFDDDFTGESYREDKRRRSENAARDARIAAARASAAAPMLIAAE